MKGSAALLLLPLVLVACQPQAAANPPAAMAAAAQPPKPDPKSPEGKIANATSAAPASIAGAATVMDWPATPDGQIPEIPSEKSGLASVIDKLPRVIEKFSAIEDQTKKVMTDVGEVTGKIKHNPLLKLGVPKSKSDGNGK